MTASSTRRRSSSTRRPALARRGSNWFFDYAEGEADDEAVYRLGEHRFVVGEYVSVADDDGRPLAYKVTDIQPA